MTKVKLEAWQDGLGRSSSHASSFGIGFGSGSPLQRWSNVCFMPSAGRSSVAEANGLQILDCAGLVADQSAIGGI